MHCSKAAIAPSQPTWVLSRHVQPTNSRVKYVVCSSCAHQLQTNHSMSSSAVRDISYLHSRAPHLITSARSSSSPPPFPMKIRIQSNPPLHPHLVRFHFYVNPLNGCMDIHTNTLSYTHTYTQIHPLRTPTTTTTTTRYDPVIQSKLN